MSQVTEVSRQQIDKTPDRKILKRSQKKVEQSTFLRYCKFVDKTRRKKKVVPMLILAQCLQLENSKDNICLVQVPELEKQYLDAGYQRCERSYKIKYQRKEYTVICLEFRDDKNSAEPIVIIPEFLIPGRSYPVFVYLYAIALYSGSPEKGQRWAAEETRKYFGLDTFAHTTLGRALKVFVRNIEEATKASDNIHNETSSNDKEKNEIQNSNAGQSDTHKESGFPTVKSTEALRKRAAQFLRSILAKLRLKPTRKRICRVGRVRRDELRLTALVGRSGPQRTVGYVSGPHSLPPCHACS